MKMFALTNVGIDPKKYFEGHILYLLSAAGPTSCRLCFSLQSEHLITLPVFFYKC